MILKVMNRSMGLCLALMIVIVGCKPQSSGKNSNPVGMARTKRVKQGHSRPEVQVDIVEPEARFISGLDLRLDLPVADDTFIPKMSIPLMPFVETDALSLDPSLYREDGHRIKKFLFVGEAISFLIDEWNSFYEQGYDTIYLVIKKDASMAHHLEVLYQAGNYIFSSLGTGQKIEIYLDLGDKNGAGGLVLIVPETSNVLDFYFNFQKFDFNSEASLVNRERGFVQRFEKLRSHLGESGPIFYLTNEAVDRDWVFSSSSDLSLFSIIELD